MGLGGFIAYQNFSLYTFFWDEPLNFHHLKSSISPKGEAPLTKRDRERQTINQVRGTSLVAQWLRIRLPMPGTQVRSLVREDPTCRGTTEPMHHNYWACALEPASHNYWARVPQLLSLHSGARAPQKEKPPQWEAHTPQWRVASARRN